MRKIFKIILFSLLSLFAFLFILVRVTTYHPNDVEKMQVFCGENAPIIEKNKKLKVLSWNIQFLAGKNYIFFFDEKDNAGPHEMPLKKDIESTLKEVARVIKNENPDIILLQEVDENAKRTYYEDQLKRILELLPQYKCHSSALYWQASYVPHPRINGRVGMKLSVISKYKIKNAIRHQLVKMPADFVSSNFQLKRAVLQTNFEVKDSNDFIVFNTHFDAFAQGSNTMERQVEQTKKLLMKTSKENKPWLIGGDFNLLATKSAYERLQESQKFLYKPESELKGFFDNFNSAPSLQEIEGKDYQKWYTHFPNDSDATKPDRTIDYIFYSKEIKSLNHHVRQHDALKISDHFPVIMEFQL
ncbi:MAG: endonuclease/exonuclease/phosphatase family protein [Spirochaetia bacterium]|nr:endonuclease/exonuclease/phosphatase family protein [Spirochaetia bacterium]